MLNAGTDNQEQISNEESIRMHYLDWLLVIAILVVVFFHALRPFDELGDWIIKNSERSTVVTIIGGFLALWGMPFFFLMAGATSWFSLRRRTVGQYIRVRVNRLLIPFIIGSIILTPIQAYFAFVHNGWWQKGFVGFILSSEMRNGYYSLYHPLTFGPEFFGRVGYHLWFVAFLFLFVIIALPVFLWLKRNSGKQFITSLTWLAKWRGGLLMFVIPMVLACFVLQQNPPSGDYGWADFVYFLLFFISGYILIADNRFLHAIHRDWIIYLILGVPCTLFFVLMLPKVWDWLGSPGTWRFYVSWTVYSLNGWCWIMVMVRVGMRFLDYSNKWLEYLREAVFPVFIIHHPVIAFVAFYAVQWEVHLTIKLLVILVGSFSITLGIFEFLIRRMNPVRALFGLKRCET